MSKFSVVMTVYDNGVELEEHLKDFLTQDYPEGYEVIVVDESSTDNSDDILKLHMQQYPHLYKTFLPKPYRDVIRKRLALTLGVKAAKNEWVILSDIHSFPPSETWLSELSESLDKTSDLYLGYFTKKGMRLESYEEVDYAEKPIVKAERLKADGHKGKRMKVRRGKYDFIVVKREKAHDALSFFEKKIGFWELLGLRLGILFK